MILKSEFKICYFKKNIKIIIKMYYLRIAYKIGNLYWESWIVK